jgi:hypothetical protein
MMATASAAAMPANADISIPSMSSGLLPANNGSEPTLLAFAARYEVTDSGIRFIAVIRRLGRFELKSREPSCGWSRNGRGWFNREPRLSWPLHCQRQARSL